MGRCRLSSVALKYEYQNKRLHMSRDHWPRMSNKRPSIDIRSRKRAWRCRYVSTSRSTELRVIVKHLLYTLLPERGWTVRTIVKKNMSIYTLWLHNQLDVFHHRLRTRHNPSEDFGVKLMHVCITSPLRSSGLSKPRGLGLSTITFL